MTETPNSKIWAAACYFPPLFVILLFVKRKDSLIFFHAKQALGTWTVFALGYVIALLPGQFLAVIKWPVSITLAGLFLFQLGDGIIKAARGEDNPLPLIGEFFDSLAVFQKLQAR